MQNVTYEGIDAAEYRRVIAAGVDHGGNDIVPFVDERGGWPLRCCLTDSAAGDGLAIIAWSPFPWQGAYTETGPIVVHANGCAGLAPTTGLPRGFDAREITLRPYTPDRGIAYHRVQHVEPGDGLAARIDELLDHDDVDFVHARNRTGGCYAFTARR